MGERTLAALRVVVARFCRVVRSVVGGAASTSSIGFEVGPEQETKWNRERVVLMGGRHTHTFVKLEP